MAGGGAPQPTSGSGKKSVDFQLNMIPFIDLLSVLISFLLMTFVWT
jgi:biopolymer transport protein ExbD